MPKEWTADQIRQFQDYFDALMSGNSPRRRQMKFMPADFQLIETRQPPLKDQYDEWLARVICYAFSVPVSPFVSEVNRATGQNALDRLRRHDDRGAPRVRLFDCGFHLATNPDVRDAGCDPARSYLRTGVREGAIPIRIFHRGACLERNPDVADACVNPLLHYERHGRTEGRAVIG